jgi:drug/metabolite transporter (DMT)-like permease
MGEIFALATAVCYGITHFSSGLLARRATGIGVAFYAQVGGSLLLIPVAAVIPGGTPSGPALAWGVLSGVGTGLGMAFLYRGLSRGDMSVVAPVSDVNAALLPVLVGVVLLGERPSAIVWCGMAAAMPAIWLISRTPEAAEPERAHPSRLVTVGAPVAAPAATPVEPMRGRRYGLRSGVVDGLYAGAGIAITWIGLERIPAGTGLWPLAVSRVVSVLAILPLVVTTRTSLRIPYDIVVKAAAAGTIGTIGTWLYMLATREQLLAIVSILSALYPAIPVLLAVVFLRERITATQTTGLGIAAAALSIIALN